MKIDFQQGIIKYPTSNGQQVFLNKTGSFVTLQTTNGKVDITFAHGSENYLLTESSTITNAWGPLQPDVEYWLYWDINLLTAVRTFGFTTLFPVYGSTAPTHPVNNQHWFDTVHFKMFVYQTGGWREVVRVFTAKVKNNIFTGLGIGILNLPFAGSQVELTNSGLKAGRIMVDNTGSAIRKSDGTFITTEDEFFINGSPVNAVRLESTVVTATADETIASFQIVRYVNFGHIILAQYEDIQNSMIAICMEDLLTNEVGNLCVQGVITNPTWDFPTVGAPLWVTGYGLLTNEDPHVYDAMHHPEGRVPVARVLTKNSIFFDQGLGGKGDKGSAFGELPLSSTGTYGVTRLSVPPVDDTNPIAVGNNDLRLIQYVHPASHQALMISTDSYGLLTGLDAQTQLHQLADRPLSSLSDVLFLTPPETDNFLQFDGEKWNNTVVTPGITSIDVTGGDTGLHTSGGPITTAGTITLNGVLNTTNGGTGLAQLGTSLQLLRTNAAATAMEWVASTPAAVSLGNVDNTADMDKPVSTWQAAADTEIYTTALTAAKDYADGLSLSVWTDKGVYDASITNEFPATGGSGPGGNIAKGDMWTVSVLAGSGPLVGKAVGTTLRALIANPGQIEDNWAVVGVGFGYTAANIATPLNQFVSTSSTQLASVISDKTGTGILVFNNAPTFIAPLLGSPTSGNFSTGTFTWPTTISSLAASASALKSPTTTGLTTITGPVAGTTRAKTVRDTDDTILELGGNYTPTGTWDWRTTAVSWPDFNQSTTGTASKAITLNTARNIYGHSFDGSANITSIITSAFGGTGNGFTKFTGPTTTERTFILPDANNVTLLYNGGALGTPASGTLTNNITFPTLNQNTTGSANSLKSQDTTGLFTISGPSTGNTVIKSVRDAHDILLELGGTYTTTGTWIFNNLITAPKLVIGSLTYTPTSSLSTIQSNIIGDGSLIIQNSNSGITSSTNVIINTNNSTSSAYYGAFGINSSTYSGTGNLHLANAVYLTATTGELVIGTTTSNGIHFVVNNGTVDALTISSGGVVTISTALSSSSGGTGNAFTKFTGPASTEKSFALPNQNATLLYSGGALGTPISGDLVNCSFPTLNQNTTGIATYATNLKGGVLGSIPYQGSVDNTDILAPNTTATKKFLRQTGTGTVGAIPAWDTVVVADLPVVTPSKGGTGIANSDTNTIDFTGNFGLTLTLTAASSVTVPTTGKLDAFPSGTAMIFLQNAAPTGWTRNAGYDGRALHIGASVTAGGIHDPTYMNVVPAHSHGFTTGAVSANHTHAFTTGGYSADHAHYTTTGNESADHSHSYTAGGYTSGDVVAGGYSYKVSAGIAANTGGRSAAHTHAGWSGGQNANHTHSGTTGTISANHSHSGGTDNGSSQTNWHPYYVTAIMCTKN